MDNQNGKKFSFELQGFGSDTFHVVRFTGTEGLCRIYQFEITLLSSSRDIDFGKALQATATLTVHRVAAAPLVWHGVLCDLKQLQHSGEHYFYRAVLVPKAWELTQTQHSQIFLNMDITQFLSEAMQSGGLAESLDFHVNTVRSYPKREYVCQYNESHFNFISRWMERNGFYFYFDQSGSQEKMVVTDHMNTHQPHPGGARITYSEDSGLDAAIVGQAVKNFYCEQRRVPKEVMVRDYHYPTPELDIQAKSQVSPSGTGSVYIHGGHIRSLNEAKLLAAVRAQQLRSREKVFFGESNAPFLQPGYVAELDNHYRDDFNQKYLVVEVKHQGAQESWLTSGLDVKGLEPGLYYRNTFAAIPSTVQFRPEKKTPKPSIMGALKAVVDAEGGSQYAELDTHGRYKVIMPFDISGRQDGKASTWLRMIQPYGGEGHGMHFPLHKGTEVAVIHYEGDPDRPVIAGTAPNPRAQSVVTEQNQTMCNITSSGGNLIHIQDQEGSERILLHSTAQGNFIRIGAHNDPASFGDDLKKMATNGIQLTTPQWFNVSAQFANAIILVENTQTNLGAYSCNTIGLQYTLNVGASITTNCAVHTEYGPAWYEMRASVRQADAAKEQAIATLQQTVGEHTRVIGEHTDTIGDHTQTIGEHTQTIGEHTQTIGGHTQTIGEHTQTLGDHTQTIGEHTQTIGQHTQTLGEHTQTVGEHTQTIGQHTQAIGQLEQNAGEINSIAGDVTNLWGALSVVAGEVGIV